MARILIVDDEQENRDALRRALGDNNPSWNIRVAANESDGCQVLQEQIGKGEPIDVVSLLSHIFSSTAPSAGSGHPVAREA